MRLVFARCTVDYEGRLTAHLPEATRLIMVKSDGCVAIHADGGAYKPLNWMNAPNKLVEEEGVWRVSNPKGEVLIITLHEIFSDFSHEMGIDPGLQKDGVEAHLQELLADDPSFLVETIAVEIKRRGEIDGVEQLTRYLDFLNRDPLIKPVRGIFAAQEIRPQAKVLAEDRGIQCVVIDYDEIRGVESNRLRLF